MHIVSIRAIKWFRGFEDTEKYESIIYGRNVFKNVLRLFLERQILDRYNAKITYK